MSVRLMLSVGVLCAAGAWAREQRPQIALLPVELPSKIESSQLEVDDHWNGIVLKKAGVDVALPDDVRSEYKRKFKNACPENEMLECLAWMAEHTSSTYSIAVKVRKVSSQGWQMVASIGARNRSPIAQPPLHEFSVTDPKKLKEAVLRELDLYLAKMDLQKLPLNPGVVEKPVQVVVDAPKKPVEVVMVKPVEPKVVVVPAKPVEEQGGGLKTVGLAVGALGVAAVVAGGVVFGMQASEADRIAKARDSGSLLLVCRPALDPWSRPTLFAGFCA